MPSVSARRQGPHAELVAKGGDYARLWNRQTGAFGE